MYYSERKQKKRQNYQTHLKIKHAKILRRTLIKNNFKSP